MTGAKGSLPLGTGVDPQTRRVMEQLIEKTDVNEGLRGDPLDRGLKVRDLIDLGLAKALSRNAQRLVSGGNLQPTIAAPDLAVPPAPTGFSVSGGFSHIFLSWDNPQELYRNHSYTVIYRNTVDNVANAVAIAQVATGSLYADLDVSYGSTYYYWVRFVSEADVLGPFNSSVGQSAKLNEDPGELLDRLEGKITSLELSNELNTYVDNLADQYVLKIGMNGVVAGFGLAFTGPDYNPSNPYHSIAIFNVDTFAITHPSTGGTSTLAFVVEGGKVVMDGASIKNATITSAQVGTITVDKISGIDASYVNARILNGSITNAKIGSFIRSDNYVAMFSGWTIDKSGYFEIHNVFARGNIQATSLQAGTAMVDTLNVAGEAITAIRYGEGASGTLISGNQVSAVALPPMALPASISGVLLTANTSAVAAGSRCNVFVEFLRNGTLIKSCNGGALEDQPTANTFNYFDPTPGTSPSYTLRLRAGANSGGHGAGNFDYYSPSLTAHGAKR